MAARSRDRTACQTAAKNGQLECLKHAHEHGCPWDEKTCESAAKNGHLECLKYAREHGCPLGLLDHILDPLSLRYQTRLDCFRIYGVVFNKFASKILKIFSFFRRRPVEPPDPVEPVVPVVDDPRSRTTRIREQTARLMSLIDEDTSILPEGDYLKLCRDLLNLHTRLPG